MNANDKGGFDWIWYIFISLGGLAGIWNLKKATSKKTESEEIKLLELEIKHLKEYNTELEKKIVRYQKIIKDDANSERGLE